MHFGLLQENDQFVKKTRTAVGDETGDPHLIDWQSNDEQARVIGMAKLAKTLGKDGEPGQFAMNMIEGVPTVIFNLEIDAPD